MKNMFTQGRLAALIVLVVLVIDQVIKICVKTGMYLHESIHVTDWFYIYFTENNGMAFGMEIIGKLFLSLFRIVAVVLIAWYLTRVVKQKRWEILLTACSTVNFSAPVPIRTLLPGCLWDKDMLTGCTEEWSTCFISRLLIPTGPTGCHS